MIELITLEKPKIILIQGDNVLLLFLEPDNELEYQEEKTISSAMVEACRKLSKFIVETSILSKDWNTLRARQICAEKSGKICQFESYDLAAEIRLGDFTEFSLKMVSFSCKYTGLYRDFLQ